jgi:CheY-like chemotaxis protein
MSRKGLIVDDEEELRELLQSALTFILPDATWDISSSGNEAIKMMENDEAYSLIICDWNMADGTGVDVYKVARKMLIPFILFSGGALELRPEFNQLNNKDHGFLF